MQKFWFYPLILTISFVYLFSRVYKIDQKIEFRLDQGVHLLETYQMVQNKKIRLIGPMVTSKSYDGRNFYIGGNYYYALGILGIVSRWDPVKITALYNIFEFIFIIFFILWLRKKYNPHTSVTVFLFLTSFKYLITHSRFFWNPHFLIPLGILLIYFLDSYHHKKQTIFLFLASIIFGNAVSFHYSAVIWFIPLITVSALSKKKVLFVSFLSIISGTIIGALPIIIFEIRHQFYNLKTIYFIFTHFKENSGLTPHYFVYPTLIFILYTFAYIQNMFKDKKIFIFLSTVSIFFIGYIIPSPSPLDNLKGWDYPTQKQVAALIIDSNCPPNYNIAATIGGDTRSYDLRYLLTLQKCPPMEVESYPNAQTLFLIAPPTRPPQTETVWEIDSFRPFDITHQQEINDHLVLYRLNK